MQHYIASFWFTLLHTHTYHTAPAIELYTVDMTSPTDYGERQRRQFRPSFAYCILLQTKKGAETRGKKGMWIGLYSLGISKQGWLEHAGRQ